MERLRHPHIVNLIGSSYAKCVGARARLALARMLKSSRSRDCPWPRTSGTLNILMEYVAGKSLDDLLHSMGPLQEPAMRECSLSWPKWL